METEIFTLCDFAQDNNGKLIVVGTFDTISSQAFPCTHPSCSIACRLRFSEKETGEHEFKLKFVDSNGKDVLQPIAGKIQIRPPKAGQNSTVNLVFNIGQLRFENPGRYAFELYLDDDWKSGLPLNLLKQ